MKQNIVRSVRRFAINAQKNADEWQEQLHNIVYKTVELKVQQSFFLFATALLFFYFFHNSLFSISIYFAVVKIFAFIMAVIILALSGMPCADIGAASKQSAKFEIAKESKNQTPFRDDCSPFCQCNCCAGFSINHQIVAVPVVNPIQTHHHAERIIASVIKVYLPIWQPPQLI